MNIKWLFLSLLVPITSVAENLEPSAVSSTLDTKTPVSEQISIDALSESKNETHPDNSKNNALTNVSPTPFNLNNDDNLRFREMFKQAKQALRHGRTDEFKSIHQQLEGYVLAPYLQQMYLLDRITLKNRSNIQAFLDRYDGEPVTYRVRSRFLWLLARNNQTNLFLTYYRPTSSISLQCHWLKFRLKTDENRRDIFDHAQRIWLHGKSRPDACDPVFAAMKKSGELTPGLIWQRLSLAVKQRQSGLVSYLTRLLPKDQQDDGRWAKRVMARPARLATAPSKQLEPIRTAEIAALIMAREIWRDSDKALTLIEKASPHYRFSHAQKTELARNIALSLASEGHPRASEWLDNIAANESSELLLRWKLAHELREGNWQTVKTWLANTPPPSNSENDWNYWQARADMELGNMDEARQRLLKLSDKRSYYGFLASAMLNKSPNLEHKPYPFSYIMVDQLSQMPGAQKAYELWQLDQHLSARREWNHFKAKLPTTERKHMAALAHQWGWHDQVIYSLSESGLMDSVNMRFPLAFSPLMEKASKDARLDLTLSLAIARKESAFMPDARSSVGAIGLMQLMPYTAKYIARKEKLPFAGTHSLKDPLTNLQLGTRYMKYLMDEHQGNAVLATASYNAGRHKVANWLPDNKQVPADIWIETVPYKETRSYIKNVLAYQQIYRSLLGQQENYFETLVELNITATP